MLKLPVPSLIVAVTSGPVALLSFGAVLAVGRLHDTRSVARERIFQTGESLITTSGSKGGRCLLIISDFGDVVNRGFGSRPLQLTKIKLGVAPLRGAGPA